MNSFFKYFTDIFTGVKSLLTGMTVTGRYFFSPWEIVTQQYPENRKTLKMFDRFKGEVIMPHNENNQHRCTGCGICETNCPNGSIEMISDTDRHAGRKKGKDHRQAHLPPVDVHILRPLRQNLPVRCTGMGTGVRTCRIRPYQTDKSVKSTRFIHHKRY